MKIHRYPLALILACATLTLSASPDAAGEAESLVVRAKKAAQANNSFATDLYKRIKSGKDNLFFSPYSVTTALAMTRAGADGETARQMDEVLHTSGLNAIDHSALREALTPKQVTEFDGRESKKVASYQLDIANALWGQEGFAFKDAFLKRMREDYLAPLARLDFKQAEQARKTINDWVAKKTNDRIKDIIPPGQISPDMRLVLANAIYFKAKWADQFSERATKDAPFHAPDGDVEVKMMRRTGHYKVAENEQVKLVEIPYQGRDTSMVILLPTKKDGLAALEDQLDAEKLSGWTQQLKGKRVALQMPRFEFTRPLDLGSILKTMGMGLAFDAEQADFTGMTEEEPLFIGAVLHKAFVKLNEKGTEAAAATVVMMRAGSAMPTEPPAPFIVDRPFLFLIRHQKTGAILFMGRVTNPNVE